MSVSSKGFKAKPLAGRLDAVSLGLLSISGMMMLPLASSIQPLVAGILAAGGSSGLAWARVSKGGDGNSFPREGFTLPSDAVEPPSMGPNGVRLGFTKDKGLPVDIVNGLMTRHTAIIGQSGVGKTTLIEYLLWQQTVRGDVTFKAEHDEDRLSGSSWILEEEMINHVSESGFKTHLLELLDNFIEYRGEHNVHPRKGGVVRFGNGLIKIDWQS